MKIRIFSVLGCVIALSACGGEDVTPRSNSPEPVGTSVPVVDAGNAQSDSAAAQADATPDTNVVDAGSNVDVATIDATVDTATTPDAGIDAVDPCAMSLANVQCEVLGTERCGFVCTCKKLWAPSSVASFITCDDAGSAQDAGLDVAIDVTNDTTVDAGTPDAVVDAPVEATVDATVEATVDAGTTDSGTVVDAGSDADSTLGTLVINVVIPSRSTPDYVRTFVEEMGSRSGRPLFNGATNVHEQLASDRTTVTVNVLKGANIKLNGVWDPPNRTTTTTVDYWAKAYCNAVAGVTARRVAISATLDGAPVAPPTVMSNGQGGCDLLITAIPAVTSTNDVDGDGDPAGVDCDDRDSLKFHGQIESWNDVLDLNCDGSADPAQYVIRTRFSGPLGFDPIVHALGSLYPTVYQMVCGSAGTGGSAGWYCNSPALTAEELPLEFYLDNSQAVLNGASPWYEQSYDQSTGICTASSVEAYAFAKIDGTLIPVPQLPVNGTCHRFIDPALVK